MPYRQAKSLQQTYCIYTWADTDQTSRPHLIDDMIDAYISSTCMYKRSARGSFLEARSLRLPSSIHSFRSESDGVGPNVARHHILVLLCSITLSLASASFYSPVPSHTVHIIYYRFFFAHFKLISFQQNRMLT